MKTEVKISKPILKKVIIKDFIRVKVLPCKNNLRGNFSLRDKIRIEYDIISKDVSSAKRKKEEIKEIYKEVEEKKHRKKQFFSWLFLLINVIVVAAIFINQFTEGNIMPLNQLFAEKPYWRFMFLAFTISLFQLVLETIQYSLLLYKSTKKARFFLCYQVLALGRYYDAITPLSSGGEPMQIYTLTKNGVSGDVATGVPLGKYFTWMLAMVVMGMVVLIVPNNYFGNTIVNLAAWLGLGAITLIFIFTMLVSTSKKIGPSIIITGLKVLYKFKIVKNYTIALKKALTFTRNYQNTIRSYFKSIPMFLTQTILSAITILLHALVAYSIYLMFNYNPLTVLDVSFYEILAKVLICDLAVSIFPLPGGTGAAEISFVLVFSELFTGGAVFWAMLFWRFLTYYGFILQGIIFVFAQSFASNKGKKIISKKGKITVIEE